MKLHTTTHSFEFLTPAWLGGARPAEAAEVRIATLRGHLRQWLRLLYPGQNVDQDIFGRMAEDGDHGPPSASKVTLRLDKPVQTSNAKNLVGYTGARDNNEALANPESYFLWPLRTQSRGVLMPGASSEFTLHISWLPMPGCRTPERESALAPSIRCLSLLGSIGTRATRGYGSLWPKNTNLTSVAQLSQELSFLPDSVSVRLLDGEFRDGRQALAAGARWMRSFRIGSARFGTTNPLAVNDHDVADPVQTPRPNAAVYRQAIGLPLTQRFNRGRNNTTTVQSRHRHDGPETDRYPSPLRLKVIKVGGRHRLLVVLLRDLLLPEGTNISLSNRRTATLRHDLVNAMMQSGTAIH